MTDFPSDLSEKVEIPEEYLDFYSRLSDRILGGGVLADLAGWLCSNTYLEGNRFSFVDHEFQIAIANDTRPEACIQKCSQVGLSELAFRISLALCAITNSRALIYVFPSATFASEVCKARIDPIIESSPRLSEMIVKAANSSKMKRIGNSTMYIGGAATQKQAISRPAQALIIDEYDFCNMMVLTSYSSRLRHAGTRKFVRKFSTPTVSDYGIDAEYQKSDKKRYYVKCGHCGYRQAPDFVSQVVIPGYANDFATFDKSDLLDPNVKISEAYIRCLKCGKELDSALADKDSREWVAEYLTRLVSGYAVKPFDLTKYNATYEILKQFDDYSRRQDYYNFVLGETYNSNQNQVNIEVVRANTIIRPQERGSGCYMGVDVGKYCHILIGKELEAGKVHVIASFRITTESDKSLKDQIVEIYNKFECYRGVIDAGPDLSLGTEVRKELGVYFHQCVYVKNGPKIGYYQVDENTGVITCARTKGFDSLVEEINKPLWSWPLVDNAEEIYDHLKSMKRVEEINDEGTKVAKWRKVSDMDHYLHAAMYLKLAMDIDLHPVETGKEEHASPPLLAGVTVGGGLIQRSFTDFMPEQETIRQLLTMFRVR